MNQLVAGEKQLALGPKDCFGAVDRQKHGIFIEANPINPLIVQIPVLTFCVKVCSGYRPSRLRPAGV